MRFPLSESLARQIETYMRVLLDERPISDSEAHQIVKSHHALPLMKSMDGYIALALTGEVLEFRWTQFDEPLPLWSRGRGYGALRVASMRYPELAQLLPTRNPEDSTCDLCEGSGRHPLAVDDERVICECGNLGFVPAQWPDGRPAPAPYRSNVFPDLTPTVTRMTRVYDICADHDVGTDEELQELLHVLFDEPESEVRYFRPKDRPGNPRIEQAVREGVIRDEEHAFFYYEREAGSCDFVRVQPYELDDRRADFLFGYDKRNLLWAKEVTAREMFTETRLALTDRAKRAIEADLQKDRNPIEVKPGAFGISVDVLKLWPLVRRWWRKRRRSP